MVVNSVHWFRKGLRLHDNPALQEALNGADTVRCVYILDPWFAGAANVGINRWRFLLEALEDLDSSLKKLNSRLFVVRGQPTDVFPRLLKEWKVTRLTFEYDPEPYGKERDGAIIKMAQEFGVETIRFQTIVSRLELPRRPLPTITQQQMDKCRTKIADNHDQLYSIPSLEELGFRTEGLPPAIWRGGESEALDRLNKHLDKKTPEPQNSLSHCLKLMFFSGRDKRIPGRPPLSPRMDRPRGQGPRPMPPQGDRKRPLSPPPKSSGKGPAPPMGKPAIPGSASAAGSGSGSGSNKPSNTLSRREELLKQLKAVEDAIARKRAKIPAK
ncbi:Cryptochrome-2 [Collichthys lucidus]|uniref:Cryptochrome-2 n=1 Tax=Collichthys lucidus TaxID=240159 RepID=A0A4U5UHP6_COLLU|nr:Cryptochrome-2 [Collichthys lucidus]